MKNIKDDHRYLFLAIIFFIFFAYLLFVIFKLTIVNGEKYSSQKDIQNKFFDDNGERGTIYGTLKNGDLVKVAYDEPVFLLVVSPKEIPSSYDERLFMLLSDITKIDKASFLKILTNKNDMYAEVKVLDKEEAQKVENLGLRGVYTTKKFKRNYPYKYAMSTVLGFVGGGQTGFGGKYGLEKYYEKDLISNHTSYRSFANLFGEQTEVASNYNIITSLEPNVSVFLQKLLTEMKQEWEADSTNAIVLDLEKNEIIAIESNPSFDPNNYKNEEVINFQNKSISNVYELGSIMKPITMSAGVNEKLVTATSTFTDKGYVKVDEYTIKNFDEKVRGVVTMQDVISQSLNTGAVYVQQLLGKDLFKKYFDAFGLEEQTGVDFPNESFNLTDNLDTHTNVNFATAAFGQGVAISPLGMLSALSIIPNGGKEVCPHFLRYKENKAEEKYYFECDRELHNPISTTTALTVKNMMIELVESGLAKGRYKDKNYFVGAKTGTAQLPSPDGKYYKDRFIHSYYTFFPGKNPRFAVLIYQVNPKKGMLASLTLAPFATKIKDFLLNYYEVLPDRI